MVQPGAITNNVINPVIANGIKTNITIALAVLSGAPGSSPSSRLLFAIAGRTCAAAITKVELIVAAVRRSLMQIAYDKRLISGQPGIHEKRNDSVHKFRQFCWTISYWLTKKQNQLRRFNAAIY